MADNADNSGDELNEETLQAKLHEYRAALESEFTTSPANNGPTTIADELAAARTLLRKHAPTAIAQIVWLSKFAASDSTKLSASKYIYEEAYSEGANQGSTLAELLEQLAQQPTGPTPNS